MAILYVEKVAGNVIRPRRGTIDSACYDVFANLKNRNVKVFRGSNVYQVEHIPSIITLYPGERAMIPTGYRMCCDPGWKIEIAPRSGKAIKEGLTLINAIGIVDADFRHEVMVLVVNVGDEPIGIHHEERIAQLSLEPVHHVDIVEGPLPDIESDRSGGFGSTGR